MIQITVSKEITIVGLPPKTKSLLKKALTLPNLEFFKMQRMGLWAAREFKYYREPSEDTLVVPRGCCTRLNAYLAEQKLDSSLIKDWVQITCTLGKSAVELRDYQALIVDKIVQNLPSEGIIVAGTGAGKTIMALELAHRLGKTTTVLCHNTVLVDQFVGEARLLYGLEASIIASGRKEVGNLTVATFQSLFNDEALLQRLSDNTSVLFVDECQGITSKERKNVLKAFRPRHLFGLTATPERTDSHTKGIFFLLGHPIAEHDTTAHKPVVEVMRTREKIPVFPEYHRIIDSMVENKSRNTLIAGLAVGEALQGRKVLVLTKRIQHYENLRQLLPELAGMHFISSNDSERNELLGRLKRSEEIYSIIFGTVSLLSVGTDIPSLDTLILACDMKSGVLTTQSAGRILRLFEGKPTPKIIDLWDNENPILTRQYWERRRLYLKKGWELKE